MDVLASIGKRITEAPREKVQGRRKDSRLTRFPRENLLEIGEGLAVLEGCLNTLGQTRPVSDTRSRDAL